MSLFPFTDDSRDAHARFQRWHENNPDGLLVNCPHLGTTEWATVEMQVTQ